MVLMRSRPQPSTDNGPHWNQSSSCLSGLARFSACLSQAIPSRSNFAYSAGVRRIERGTLTCSSGSLGLPRGHWDVMNEKGSSGRAPLPLRSYSGLAIAIGRPANRNPTRTRGRRRRQRLPVWDGHVVVAKTTTRSDLTEDAAIGTRIGPRFLWCCHENSFRSTATGTNRWKPFSFCITRDWH